MPATPPASPVVVARVVDSRSAPGVSAADVQALEHRLRRGDRGGVYLDLYKMTGDDIWLMHAQITTYTGIYGGAALTANFFAKLANPGRYRVSLDRFSYEITQSMIDVVKRHVRGGGNGQADLDTLRTEGDRAVWERKGMGNHFPGNALFMDVFTHGTGSRHFASAGTGHGAAAMMVGTANGKRPSEFRRGSAYQSTHGEGGRFMTVIDSRTRKVEAFFDRNVREMLMFSQIDDEPLSPTDLQWHERMALWEFLQANQDEIADFNDRTWNEARDDAAPNPNLVKLTHEVPQTMAAGPGGIFQIETGATETMGPETITGAAHFRNPRDRRWYVQRGSSSRRPAPRTLLGRLDALRNEAFAFRRRRGLPSEPPLPGRYRSGGVMN